MREKIKLNEHWQFHLGDLPIPDFKSKGPTYTQSKTERMKAGPACYYYIDDPDVFCNDSFANPDYWETVNLPHDYIIRQEPKQENNNALGYFKYENSWYRKHFNLEKGDENKRITLYFEGIATLATVYVNGCLMYHNFCGYTPFEVDITDVAFFDKENVIAIYVETDHHEGWWYEGAGIYRNVWLVKTDLVAVDLWGVYVKPCFDGQKWVTDIETTLINADFAERKITVETLIEDLDGNAVTEPVCESVSVALKDKKLIAQSIDVENPKLWDVENPNIYNIRTRVISDGAEVDRVYTRFGFRTIKFDSEKGFFLNGKHVLINGVCCHQDFGLTGKAVPDNIYRYRVRLMKEMGANGYRTAHYPHAEATMDALDEMGFLVMAETRWFESTPEGKQQLEALMKRDRNRPSVILWSIGNEEPKHLTEQGRRIAKSLIACAKRMDSERPITTAVSNSPLEATVFDLVDVIGINYNLETYDELHKKYPNKPFISSECCATGTTRAWYFENDTKKGYINAYDHDTDAWFKGRENTRNFFSERPWICGSYQWAGIEHRGETVWPRLCSQSGAVDMFLQKKDAFYQNKSHWTKEPMIHILPHWNHSGRERETLDIWAYTNCDEAELFLNGKSLGVREIRENGHAEWKAEYIPGRLEVIGRKDGKDIVKDIVETTGLPVKLKLELQNEIEVANGENIAIIACSCTDSKGRFVPDASPFVGFHCNSLGEIVGTGSDISDHVPVSSLERRMRAGIITVAVKVGKTAGTLRVYADSDGLASTRIDIELK